MTLSKLPASPSSASRRARAGMLLLFCCLMVLGVRAQEPPDKSPDPERIVRQFGKSFEYVPEFPVLTGDMYGEGTEDAVVVARAEEDPKLDEAALQYKVIDPMFAHFGWKDPHYAAMFNAQVDKKPRFLLIVQNWRAPRRKFVVSNFPFDKLSLSRLLAKKRPVTSICGEESSGAKSAIFWDGKKWQWRDLGVGMD